MLTTCLRARTHTQICQNASSADNNTNNNTTYFERRFLRRAAGTVMVKVLCVCVGLVVSEKSEKNILFPRSHTQTYIDIGLSARFATPTSVDAAENVLHDQRIGHPVDDNFRKYT